MVYYVLILKITLNIAVLLSHWITVVTKVPEYFIIPFALFLTTEGYFLARLSNFKTESPDNVVSSVRNVPLSLSVQHKRKNGVPESPRWFMGDDCYSWLSDIATVTFQLCRFRVKRLNLKNKDNEYSSHYPLAALLLSEIIYSPRVHLHRVSE